MQGRKRTLKSLMYQMFGQNFKSFWKKTTFYIVKKTNEVILLCY